MQGCEGLMLLSLQRIPGSSRHPDPDFRLWLSAEFYHHGVGGLSRVADVETEMIRIATDSLQGPPGRLGYLIPAVSCVPVSCVLSPRPPGQDAFVELPLSPRL